MEGKYSIEMRDVSSDDNRPSSLLPKHTHEPTICLFLSKLHGICTWKCQRCGWVFEQGTDELQNIYCSGKAPIPPAKKEVDEA